MTFRTPKISGTQAIQLFQVARYGALMLSSILLTKSGLAQSDIGHYETFILAAGSLSFFWINGILNSFLSLYNKYENKSKVITTTAVIMLSFSLLVIALLIVFLKQFIALYQFYYVGNLFLLLLIYFLFNNISFILDYILLAKNNVKGLVGLSIYHLVFQTFLIAAPAYIFGNFEMVINGLICFVAIKFLITLVIIGREMTLPIDRQLLKNYLKTASPLIISFFLGGVSIYVDGIIVNNYYDKATFAMYQYGAREFPLSLLLANAFSASMALHISKSTENIHQVKTGSLQLINRLFPICIFLLIVSQWLYPIIFNPNFSVSYVYFNIYLLLLIPRLVFPHSILTGMGKTGWIMAASMVEFILNIAISLTLNHFIGLQGIAFGTVIAFLVNKSILGWQLHREGIRVSAYIPVRQLSIYSAILVAVFIIFTYAI